MCRSIKALFNFDPPATNNEVRAAALQFVRKPAARGRAIWPAGLALITDLGGLGAWVSCERLSDQANRPSRLLHPYLMATGAMSHSGLSFPGDFSALRMVERSVNPGAVNYA